MTGVQTCALPISTREGSIKFPVAPQSMRAVVVMVLALYHSLIGNRSARSDLLATITEAILREEEDVTASSCFKKTAPRFRRHLLQFARGVITQWVSFLSLPSLLHISLSLPPPMLRQFILALGFEWDGGWRLLQGSFYYEGGSW